MAVEQIIITATKPERWVAHLRLITPRGVQDDWTEGSLAGLANYPEFEPPTDRDRYTLDMHDQYADRKTDCCAEVFLDSGQEASVLIVGPDEVPVRGLASVIRAETEKPLTAPPIPEVESTPQRSRWAWVPSFLRDTTLQLVGGILAIVIVAAAVAIFH